MNGWRLCAAEKHFQASTGQCRACEAEKLFPGVDIDAIYRLPQYRHLRTKRRLPRVTADTL